ACVFPEHATPRDTSVVSIGGLCAEGVAPSPDSHGAGVTFVVGRRFQIGYSKMTATRWAWWCHPHTADADERAALMTMPADAMRDCMLERYRGWCAPVEELISATEMWLRTPIHDVPTLPTWKSGRVLLLGDAAHAMSPAAGQGASFALEDTLLFAR